jgi:CHAT domain-containing protein
MYAGAGHVMASLWNVDDAATAELMKRFYGEMLGPRRSSPAAALRAAQRGMRDTQRWRAPFYWSGFVVQGDWK